MLPVGTQMTMTLDARGTRQLYYVWRKNGTVVNNDTSGYYRVPGGVTLSSSGLYRVTVENSFGKARSLPYKLTVIGNMSVVFFFK